MAFDKHSPEPTKNYQIIKKEAFCEICIASAVDRLFEMDGIEKVESNYNYIDDVTFRLFDVSRTVERRPCDSRQLFAYFALHRSGSNGSIAARSMRYPLCPIPEAQARVCPASLRWHQADAALWHGCGGNALLCIPVSVSVDAYHLVGRFAVVYLHWPQ